MEWRQSTFFFAYVLCIEKHPKNFIIIFSTQVIQRGSKVLKKISNLPKESYMLANPNQKEKPRLFWLENLGAPPHTKWQSVSYLQVAAQWREWKRWLSNSKATFPCNSNWPFWKNTGENHTGYLCLLHISVCIPAFLFDILITPESKGRGLSPWC